MALEDLRKAAIEEITCVLDTSDRLFSGDRWVRRALSRQGRLLSGKQGFAWGLLPLLVCEAAGGEARLAMPLAAVAECFISATDVLDDVQDGDSVDSLERLCGAPTAINVGLYLVFLANMGVHRLSDHGATPRVVRDVAGALAIAGARACAGQQLDLDQSDRLLTEVGYTQMIQLKAGALVEGICRAGAIVADASSVVIEGYGCFGRKLGMALQVGNDLRAMSSLRSDRGDLAHGKRTLPLIFASESTRGCSSSLVSGLHDQLGPNLEGQARLLQSIRQSGALLYTSLIADVYFEEALACLGGLNCRDGDQLRDFILSGA